MNCSMPASRASSTPYWITGLSTTGSISLGMALVAGKKRVPIPATGNTALRMRGVDMEQPMIHERQTPAGDEGSFGETCVGNIYIGAATGSTSVSKDFK